MFVFRLEKRRHIYIIGYENKDKEEFEEEV